MFAGSLDCFVLVSALTSRDRRPACARLLGDLVSMHPRGRRTARRRVGRHDDVAAVGANPPGTGGETLQQHVVNSGTLEFNDANVCISFESTPPAEGQYVTVQVQKPVYTLTRLLPFSKITVKATSTMRIETFQDLAGPQAYSTSQNLGTCT